MASEFIDIGFGNIAQASRIICVAAADRGTLVDCCAGKKCKSVIVTDSGLVLTSALSTSEIKEMLG